MYLSYEGGKLTSTLVNLDIEEMCFCFSCAILKHIDRFEKDEKKMAESKLQTNLDEIPED